MTGRNRNKLVTADDPLTGWSYDWQQVVRVLRKMFPFTAASNNGLWHISAVLPSLTELTSHGHCDCTRFTLVIHHGDSPDESHSLEIGFSPCAPCQMQEHIWRQLRQPLEEARKRLIDQVDLLTNLDMYLELAERQLKADKTA
jgi:hypothetical protein